MNKAIIEKEDFEKIKFLEKSFRTVVYAQYKRNNTKEECDLVNAMVSKYYNKPITKVNYGCGLCQYKLFEQLGKLYFRSKEYYDNKNKEIEETENKEIEEIPENTVTEEIENKEIPENKVTNKDKTNKDKTKKDKTKKTSKKS